MKQDPSTDVDALWTRFKEDGDQGAREQLILTYSPLVKYVAGRVSASLPQTVETADLISYGIFGLIDAIEKYDTERGIKFETYAIARIKGRPRNDGPGFHKHERAGRPADRAAGGRGT